jgi:hypothetical protein
MANPPFARDTGRGGAGFSEIKTYTSKSRLHEKCRELFMKTSQWQSRIESTVLAFALLFVAAIVQARQRRRRIVILIMIKVAATAIGINTPTMAARQSYAKRP